MKVVIWGTGKASKIIEEMFCNKLDIVCYTETYIKNQGIYNNKPLIDHKYLPNYEFDKILIASQYSIEIYEFIKSNYRHLLNKVIMIYDYIEFIEYKSNMNMQLSKVDKKIDGIVVTGMSYMYYGIINKSNIINLSYPSQDLKRDYNIFKYAIENRNLNKSVSKCIIGLSYFSLEYDIQKSKKNRNLIKKYDMFFNDVKIKDLFNDLTLYHSEEEFINIFNDERYSYNSISLNDVSKLEEQARLDSNKNYKLTRNSNKDILISYIKLSRSYCIEPVIFIAPLPKEYRRYFSTDLENRFIKDITHISEAFNIDVINLFEDSRFTLDDYIDGVHLNMNGANKMTEIMLNEI